MKINRLKHEEINFEAYNDCIKSSPLGTVYAMSWYLDVLSPGWELLMSENYQYVMPLPVKQKSGIKYLMQPVFCQQLGVFSPGHVSSDVFKNFISALPYYFYYLQLNTGNLFDHYYSKKGQNFSLDLNNSYADIRRNYRKNFIRNIKKAENASLQIERQTSWDVFLDVVKNNSEGRPINKLLETFKVAMQQARQYTTVIIWSCINEYGTILSSALFLRWKNRIYYMLPVSTPEGKQKQSMSFLLDKFIEAYSGEEIILDYEGSSIPNIARFYESTGAKSQSFPILSKPRILFNTVSYIKKLIR